MGGYAAGCFRSFFSLRWASNAEPPRRERCAAVMLACVDRIRVEGWHGRRAFTTVGLLVALRPAWLRSTWRVSGVMLVVLVAVAPRDPTVRPHGNTARVGIANLLAPVGEAERKRFESLAVRAVSAVDNRLRLETRRGELDVVNQNGTMSVSGATGRPLEVFVEGEASLRRHHPPTTFLGNLPSS